jgi:hypothetical protein
MIENIYNIKDFTNDIWLDGIEPNWKSIPFTWMVLKDTKLYSWFWNCLCVGIPLL